MKSDKNYVELTSIVGSIDGFNQAFSDNDIRKPFADPYVTKQQRIRDEKITELLSSYVAEYNHDTDGIGGTCRNCYCNRMGLGSRKERTGIGILHSDVQHLWNYAGRSYQNGRRNRGGGNV